MTCPICKKEMCPCGVDCCYHTKDNCLLKKVECSGCGKEFKKGDKVVGIKQNKQVPGAPILLTHEGECHKKVWNGYLYQRDKKE